MSELFASGFNEPVAIKHAGDDRLFVVEQPGIIKVIENGSTSTLLNMTQLVGNSANEQGLLGLAFHPDFAVNGYGYFFVNYTNNSGATTISRFTSQFIIWTTKNLSESGFKCEAYSCPNNDFGTTR